MPEVRLAEWSTLGPDHGVLRGLELAADTRPWAERLAAGGVLEVTELRQGLRVRALSHVGRVRLGDLTITIEPKLAPDLLLDLLQYAFSLRNLRLLDEAAYELSSNVLVDLMVHQLHAEVRELLARGLHRRYRRLESELAVPRGRLDTRRLAGALSSATARLPCQEHPRSYDHELNQTLLAGLEVAAGVCAAAELAVSVRRLARELEEVVSRKPLDRDLLGRAERALSRITSAYEPALTLIRLLHSGTALSLTDDGATTRLPGFLFDMNRFFERLVGRLLMEVGSGFVLRDQHPLRDLMRYVPGHNPRRRRAPTPRPDFVLMRGRRVAAILDAKYRDLWETELPRDMLYQLALYALSQPPGFTAAMVYPCVDAGAREALVELQVDGGAGLAHVALRPLNLPTLREALRLESMGSGEMLQQVARGVGLGTREEQGRVAS